MQGHIPAGFNKDLLRPLEKKLHVLRMLRMFADSTEHASCPVPLHHRMSDASPAHYSRWMNQTHRVDGTSCADD